MEVFWGDDDGASSTASSSSIAPMFEIPVPETRKVTQITGHAPKSAILTEIEARKEISSTLSKKAPPKDIPKQLKRDFISGRENPTACLNQVCQRQRWNYKFVETEPSKRYNLYGCNNFAITAIVNGIKYIPGEAKNKKDAKASAATNALNEILGLNPDQEIGGNSQKSFDLYGRAVSLPDKTTPAASGGSEKVYRPIPKPVMPQKTNFLPAPSRSQAMELLKKHPVQPHENVGTLVERQLKALDSANKDLPLRIQHGTVAAFLVKKAGLPGEVVAIGTGDMSFHGEELCTNGKVVFDCHAETIARRSFRRYLVAQIRQWYCGDEEERKDCILERAEDHLLCLKDTVTVHLYMNRLPKGIARSQSTGGSISDDLRLVCLQTSGSVETKLPSDIRLQISASDVLGINKKKMVTMSGSDKMLKWNICGIQGSLLSLFMESAYLSSITVGCDSVDLDCSNLSIAVNNRLDDALNRHLPDMFVVSRIHKIGSYIIKEQTPVKSLLERQMNLSVNWTKGDEAVEVLNANFGTVDKSSLSKSGFSRISKLAFYASCLNMGDDIGISVLESHENYYTAKQSCQSYRDTKLIFCGHLKGSKMGYWINRPKQVDCFKA